MYVKSLHLENIRCFESLTLDFGVEEDVRRFVLLLGDNGVGKTTLLRCIAMGLCDETSASGLLSELSGDIIRHGCKTATIQVELWEDSQSESLVIRKELLATDSAQPEMTQIPPREPIPWNRMFACGYGIARRSVGAEMYPKYRLVDSLYTLFNYESGLWSPELALSRLERAGIDIADLLRRIERILLLPEGSIVLDSSGISVSGPWKYRLPVGALGDGYSSTFSWVADLLGWGFLFYDSKCDAQMQGIVLIDMIERDLHPSWQRRIISQLRQQLPGIQFIATTHAPMCAIGTTDLEDRECELVVLRLEDGESKAIKNQKPPRDKRVDQVLTSYLFGLPSASDDAIRDAIDRYAELTSKASLGTAEQEELAERERYLNEVLGSPGSELELRVTEAVRQTLREFRDERLAKSSKRERLLELEALNQLRRLLGAGES